MASFAGVKSIACLSCLARQTRRYPMLPHACVALAMRGVVRLVVLGLLNVRACEWLLGFLCWLAPCSCIERLVHMILLILRLVVVASAFLRGSCVGYLLNGIHVARTTRSIQPSCGVAGGFQSNTRALCWLCTARSMRYAGICCSLGCGLCGGHGLNAPSSPSNLRLP